MIPILDRLCDDWNRKNTPWIIWLHRIPDEEEKVYKAYNTCADTDAGVDIKEMTVTHMDKFKILPEEKPYSVLGWPNDLNATLLNKD